MYVCMYINIYQTPQINEAMTVLIRCLRRLKCIAFSPASLKR